jgi:hypothetical protein
MRGLNRPHRKGGLRPKTRQSRDVRAHANIIHLAHPKVTGAILVLLKERIVPRTDGFWLTVNQPFWGTETDYSEVQRELT